MFITGLSISLVHAQNDNTLNPPLISPRRGETNTGVYCYDSVEVSRIAEIILENEMLRENVMLYLEKDSLHTLNRIILEEKFSSMHEIVKLKDEQIFKLEKTPLQVIDKSWKWWHYTLAAIGAITFGFTAGVVFENMNR